MNSRECLQRHLDKNSDESCWVWPETRVSESQTTELLSIAMEIAVNFFWGNFTYTFGGMDFIQENGGPIITQRNGAKTKKLGDIEIQSLFPVNMVYHIRFFQVLVNINFFQVIVNINFLCPMSLT